MVIFNINIFCEILIDFSDFHFGKKIDKKLTNNYIINKLYN